MQPAKLIGVGIAIAIAAVVGVIAFDAMTLDEGTATRKTGEAVSRHQAISSPKAEANRRERLQSPVEAETSATPAAGEAKAENAEAGDEQLTAEEQAAQRMEQAVDRLFRSQEGYVPSAEEVKAFKATFDGLSKAQKAEQIAHAQNLVPDSAFACLAEILLDRTESEDVLFSLFHDMMNRPEELKLPLLKKLAADKRHPMSEEASGVLEMIGE